MRMKPKIRRTATPIVMVSKQHYWCLQYLSQVMGINTAKIVEKYLRQTINELNAGKDLKKPSKIIKDNPYPLKCTMPRELRIQAEVVKINNDMWGWELSDMVRIAANKAVRAHIYAFPEINKIIKRYKENETTTNNNGELQKERENNTEV